MRGKCERGRGSANADGGSVNADGAGAKVFAGDGCSQKASFGPMAAISRRGQGGRIYNNTRVRELLRRKCVKPADLTTHFPPKAFAHPRTATRSSRAFSHSLPALFRSPTQRRRTPAGCAMHSPPKTFARPLCSASDTKKRHRTVDVRCIPRRPHDTFPVEDLRSPPTATRTARALSLPHAARCIPRRPHNPFPAEDLLPPPHSDTPSPSTSAPPRSPDAHPQAARCTPADLTTHSSSKAFAPPPPFRFGHKKTAPHSGCAMPNVSVDRRCGRSFGLVSRTLFAAVAGRWRVGVGLRPQPWALRSRRCGRVLRA